jgi:Tol biopolymer transport system component
MRRALILVAAAAMLGLPGRAAAFYGNGATIVSADPVRQEEGDDSSTFAAVSADGRYVAFSTRARNFFADDDPDPPGAYRVGGIFRKDLQTGELKLVAGGDVRSAADDSLLVRGATRPSISADGRYVAFTTAQPLVPTDTNGAVDVYVRDMELPATDPAAYDIVSARDGASTPATYEKPNPDRPGLDLGADATGGASISGDGRMVVFRTNAASDLPAEGAATTPAFQVWVRDRQAKTTTLVTRKLTGGPAGGGTGPSVISGDGTTVAWNGQNATAQTLFLSGEASDDALFFYLWRRIADGPSAPTRRITGAVDLDDPGCAPGTPVTTDPATQGPCYGPLITPEDGPTSINAAVPSLSTDGRTVAFLTGSGPRPLIATGAGLDLFVTSMAPGVSRKAGTRELTREAQGVPNASFPIEGAELSGDGTKIVVATQRTTYLLPGLSFVGAPRALAQNRDLYVLDLSANTIERVTRAYDGGDSQGDVTTQPTISADGSRIAFVSGATDLFFGDANNQPDAFAVTRQAPPSPPPPVTPRRTVIPPPPGSGEPPAAPRLSLSISRVRHLTARLAVRVPAAGKLVVTGKGLRTVRATATRPVRLTLRLRASRPGKVRLTVRFTPSARTSALTAHTTVKFKR